MSANEIQFSLFATDSAFNFVLYTQPLFELIKKHSIQHHPFADDNQLYKETVPDQIQTTIEIMQNCITDVKLWMTYNKLQ